jgi:hypothetical protein
MLINTTPPPYEVDEYTIEFLNGDVKTVTVDKDLGDTVDFDHGHYGIQFKLVERISPQNPDFTVPAEELTIFTKHITAITHRKRLVSLPSPEQQEKFKTLHKLSPTVQ